MPHLRLLNADFVRNPFQPSKPHRNPTFRQAFKPGHPKPERTMPTYEYQREDGTRFEIEQRITEEPLKECPTTGQKVKRLISGGAGLVFKGSGFYLTDYARKSSSPATSSSEGSSSGSSSTSGSGKEGSSGD